MYLEEDLLELQQQGMEGTNHPHTEETKQRKGMVRREFNRRIMRFKKNKKKKKNGASGNTNNNNNNNSSNESSGDEDDDNSDASGNKIIIKLKIDDGANSKKNLPEQPKQHFSSKNLYPTSFGGRKHH